MVTVMQVTLEDADKSTRFASIYAFQKGHGGTLSNGSSLFTRKTRTLFLSSLHRHSLPEQETG